jgi:hypothetical protein
LIFFLPHPPTDHQLQPTAIAAVTSTIAATKHIVHLHRSHCKEDNIVVAGVLARGVLAIVVNCSTASTTKKSMSAP